MKTVSKCLLCLMLTLVMALSCLPVMAAEAPAMPTATITSISNDQLTFAMNFKADAVTDEQLAYYGDWFADFELTFNKEVTLNANGGADGYLSGQYDGWSENWVNVPTSDVTLEANKALKIMEFAAELYGEPGLAVTYNDIITSVKDFDCGVYLEPDFLAANPDLEVTLELRMYNPDNTAESYLIGDTYSFTTNYVAKNTATGSVYTDVSAALKAAEAGQTVSLLKDAEDDYISVYENITLDLAGSSLTAKYFTGYGDIVDSSADNSGVLVVNPARFMLQETNKQLPVYNGTGYQFAEVLGFKTAVLEDGKYAFQLLLEQSAHELVKQGAELTGVTVQADVSWTQDGNTRTQQFVYSDTMVNTFLSSYNASTGKYTKMFTLSLRGTENFEDLTTTAAVVSSVGVRVTPSTTEEEGNVSTDSNNQVAEAVTLTNEQASALVATGTQLEDGAKNLTLTTTEMEETTSNIQLQEGEALLSMDVHVEGVSADNTVPVIVTLNNMAATGLNQGNIALYHVEDGVTTEMTRVYSLAEVDAHNEYYYDIETGTITMALASFSEVAVVADTENAWNGTLDYTWYDAAKTELTIANADQLAGFGAIVGGMDGQTQDSFSGKTVKLVADINIGDLDSDNGIVFYPIGYYNSEGTYNKTNTAITSGFYAFCGTFDGNGHTIANFYQNTWEMKGDHNWYDATLQYYRDGMGLFGKVYGGTVKNLTVENFSSDGEITTTGTIAAYADCGAAFENITIFNCNPRVYNIGNGGIVGCVGWYNNAETDTTPVTFKNITVDSTNKISALWGSWDVACGGIVGQYYPTSGQTNATDNAGINMVNCHVAAQIDVYNDVCANYQYYAYRYAGMLIGSVRENETIDGHVYPNMDGITASGCTVTYGDWQNYYYCELEANSTASYTHDYQFSRLTRIANIEGTNITYLDGTTGTVPASGSANYVVVNGDHGTANATCYHFVDGAVHTHTAEENNQHIFLPFAQLVTGYGWGVTSKSLTDFADTASVIQVSAGEYATSVTKFADAGTAGFVNGNTYTVGQLFQAVNSSGVGIVDNTVQVYVSPADENSTVTGTYTAADTWAEGTLTFTGTGAATVTITDYYFCTPTTINVTIDDKQSVNKFNTVFEYTDSFLYRVGNENAVVLDKLFKAVDGVTITEGNVTVDVTGTATATYTANATDWTQGTLQFTGTGPVKVSITDNDYCNTYTLNLEVVTATNCTATSAPSVTGNSVVLLNNVSGSFSVSGGYTLYGNGFIVKLPTTVQSNYTAGYVGYVTMSGGNLDNVRIEGPVYPEMYIYRDQAQDSTDTTKVNYFYNSILINGGNNTITNSYVSGSRSAICIRGGNNITIENTTLYGGAYANMHIAGASSVTLRDLTTVQVDTSDSYAMGKTAHGLGIAVDSAVVDIYIEGDLNQYNWLCKEQWTSIVPSDYQSSFPDFFGNDKYSDYWHYLNGGTDPYVNLTFIFACNWDTTKIHDNRTTVDYATCDSTIAGVAGGIYSKVNTVGGNAIADANLADPGYTSPGFDPVAPVFSFDNSANNDADDENDAADTYCVYDEASGTLKIGVTGDSKTLDLSGVSITKDGTTLDKTAYLNSTQISGNPVTINAADGAKQTLTFKATSNDAGHDKDGNAIEGSIEYTWTVTIEMAVLAYPAPVWNMGGDYQFDTSNCYYAYYSTSQGYGEAVPIYEGVKINYYNKSGTLVELDLSGTTTLPTGSNNANANAFTYTLSDGSTLTMKFSRGWKSGATTHQFTYYSTAKKVYIYPQSLDNDNYVRAKTTNQDFNVQISYTFTDPNGQSTETVTMSWYNAAASNESVSTVQWKTFDSTNGREASICVTSDTLVTLADGTQKEIQYVSVGEEIIAWNFYTGQYEIVPAALAQVDAVGTMAVLHLNFEDGTELKVLGEHGIYDADLNTFIFIDKDDVEQYVGHNFVKQDGDSYSTVKLVSYEVTTEDTAAYTILSAYHYNVMLEGMFTVTPAHVGDNFFNPFTVHEGMKYDEAEVQADIEAYGLYTYEDFAHVLTEEQFEVLNIGHFKVSVAKGLITYEGLIYLIENFINR